MTHNTDHDWRQIAERPAPLYDNDDDHTPIGYRVVWVCHCGAFKVVEHTNEVEVDNE